MKRIVKLAVNFMFYTLPPDTEKDFPVLSVFLSCKGFHNCKNQQSDESSPHNRNNNQSVEGLVKQIDITVCRKNVVGLYKGDKVKIVEQSVV